VIPTPAPVKTTIIIPTILRQPMPELQIDPELADIPELEDDSNPASPDPPNLLQQPLTKTQPQPVQQEIPVPAEFQKMIQKIALRKKIVGFGAKDIEQAQGLKLQLDKQERLAKLEHKAIVRRLAKLKKKQKQLEYRDRTASTSSDSSNYDTPPGSPAPSTSKVKGKLKKNFDQVTNALSFSFSESRLTRASFRKKERKGWPPKS